MYDTVNMVLTKEDCPGINFKETIRKYLHDTYCTDGKFGNYINGYLGSLKVSLSENRVKIAEGSICKYYKGNNYSTLLREDTQRIIEKISDSLHLPFQKANVTRIDFGHNFLMDNEVSLYFHYLGSKSHFKRLEQNNGIYYRSKKISLVFYDKNQELRNKGEAVPDDFKNLNVLRYELRFTKRLREVFKRQKITGRLLYDNDFFDELTKRWKDHYFDIQKINNRLVGLEPTGKQKQLMDNLALLHILDVGQNQILNTITEWQKLDKIDRKAASRLRLAVKNLTKTPISKDGNELINELNLHVKWVADPPELPF